MRHTAELTSFRLSRIYAQGWNAARLAWTVHGALSNPYAAEPERSRWQAGFSNAQADPERAPAHT